MNFCSSCGSRVNLLIPAGDNRHRYVCESCGMIHYQNPNVVTGCIPEWEGRILLCRRAIEPRYGTWTLPAGFLENGESSMFGAAREAEEEANAQIREMTLFCVYSIPHINQVYTMYRGVLDKGLASPGEESLEVMLASEDEVPWDNLSFPVIVETLKLYYRDKQTGNFSTHYGEIIRLDKKTVRVEHY
ncbi:MAG: NUDIX hydrolase [Thiotrichales bacterium]|nr:MAG: NUDIX hydrolase [Thiotrichales bacterium]